MFWQIWNETLHIYAAYFVPTDHCMVNFIKKNLLGSLGEFRNRFINPIQNGQCADSTPKDVRIMKKRAHVLHAMLAGCVQVKKWIQPALDCLYMYIYSLVLCSTSHNTVSILFSEKRLLRVDSVPASQTRVCAGSEDFPTSVSVVPLLPWPRHW